MDLNIELILIGDELLNGHKKDANLPQLTTYLAAKGLKLRFVQMISDNISEISSAFKLAAQRSSIIITSGGLGPTLDDLTKEGLSSAFHLPIEFSEQSKSVTLENYKKYQRECNFQVNRYDQLPKHTTALNNSAGFAPGISYHDLNQKFTFLLLPGVPREFKAMMEDHLDFLLQNINQYNPSKQLQWRTYGIAEEKYFLNSPQSLERSLNFWYC